MVVSSLGGKTILFQDFVAHGELAIYSATLIATTIRLIGKDKEQVPPFLYREFFLWLGITIFCIAVVVYTVIKTATALSSERLLNVRFLMEISVPLVLLTIVIAFFVELIDQQRFGGFSYRALSKELRISSKSNLMKRGTQMETEVIRFPCIELEQPIGKCYVGAIDSQDLISISWTDRRRIEQQERDIEVVSGIQRPLSTKRVEELKKYVRSIDACFPTGIILAVDACDAEYDPETRTMSLRKVITSRR